MPKIPSAQTTAYCVTRAIPLNKILPEKGDEYIWDHKSLKSSGYQPKLFFELQASTHSTIQGAKKGTFALYAPVFVGEFSDYSDPKISPHFNSKTMTAIGPFSETALPGDREAVNTVLKSWRLPHNTLETLYTDAINTMNHALFGPKNLGNAVSFNA